MANEEETRKSEMLRLREQILSFISGNPIWREIAQSLLNEYDEKPLHQEESIDEQFQQFLEWKKLKEESP